MTDVTLTNTITALERERGHGQKRHGRVLAAIPTSIHSVPIAFITFSLLRHSGEPSAQAVAPCRWTRMFPGVMHRPVGVDSN